MCPRMQTDLFIEQLNDIAVGRNILHVINTNQLLNKKYLNFEKEL